MPGRFPWHPPGTAHLMHSKTHGSPGEEIGGVEGIGSRRFTVDDLLAEARAQIRRFTPAEAEEAIGAGALLVDIRPLEQRARDGLIPGARVVDRNVLEWRLDPGCAYRDPSLARPGRPLILICNQGCQSSLAAAQLQRLGLSCGDVIGGAEAWSQAYPRFSRRRFSRRSRWWAIGSPWKQALPALAPEAKASRKAEPRESRSRRSNRGAPGTRRGR
jgi:rhodanese-related sulfurtransferase